MTLRSLLLASASLGVIASASAADLPAKKAAPAASAGTVVGCPAFGAGFFQIPGSETCLKIGGYIRSNTQYTANTARGTAPYTLGWRGLLSVDARSNSEVGTIRGYAETRQSDSDAAAIQSAAYVQVGTFTAGYAASPADFSIAYNYAGGQFQPTGVGQLTYVASMGSDTLTVSATTAQSDNNTSTLAASRPDVIAVYATKVGPASVKLGAVSHEVVADTGSAQGYAFIGRADLAFDPATLKLFAGYEQGANAYVSNGGFGSVKDSFTDGSNIGTGTQYAAAIEVKTGTQGLTYAYTSTENGTQDTTSYNRQIFGLGYKHDVTKELFIRPEVYQVITNGTSVNYGYLRIQRSF